jgi:hypothetical protein
MSQLIADALLDGRVRVRRLLADEFFVVVTDDDGPDLLVNWRAGRRGWRCSCDRGRCWHIEAAQLVVAPGAHIPPLPPRIRRRARA